MVEVIKQLQLFDYWGFFTAAMILMGALVAVKKGIEEFSKTFGFETPWMKEKREKKEYRDNITSQLRSLTDRESALEKRHHVDIQTQSDDLRHLEQLHKDTFDSLISLSNDIRSLKEEMERVELKRSIDKARWNIIDFATKLKNGEKVSGEHYAIIFKKYDEYELLLEEHGLTNGQCTASMNFIRKRYEWDLESGSLED